MIEIATLEVLQTWPLSGPYVPKWTLVILNLKVKKKDRKSLVVWETAAEGQMEQLKMKCVYFVCEGLPMCSAASWPASSAKAPWINTLNLDELPLSCV